MKRLAVRLAELADRPNLLLALHKAARGKHQRPAVARWLRDADHKLDALAASILDQTAPQGHVRRFTIHDPKRREITAACFTDRVLHHALLNLTEARFEQALVPGSFACRTGFGVHAAVAAVQRHLRRFAWCVQVDVAGYFPSIDHGLLRQMLASRFKGAEHLALWHRIIDAGHLATEAAGLPKIGLPIGALTSQHLANAYLDCADRFLLALPAVRAVVRYMDDIVWWCDDAAACHHSLALLRQHLWDARRLQLKPNPRLAPSAAGIAFCGFRVRQGVVLPSQRKLQRYKAGAAKLAPWLLGPPEASGDIGSAECQRAHDNLHATLAHTQSLHFRQGVWGRLGACDGDDADRPPLQSHPRCAST